MNYKNYVQFLDENRNLKTLPLVPSFDGGGNLQYYFILGTITTQYFIIGVFLENRRVDGVGFLNNDNHYQLSIINDLVTFDADTLLDNAFFQPDFDVQITINPVSAVGGSVGNASGDYFGALQSAKKPNPIALSDKYGIVFPTIVTQKNYLGVYSSPFPSDYNVKTLELAISYNRGNSTIEMSYLTNLFNENGDFNSGERYHDWDRNIVNLATQPCFNIDDIFIKFFDWGITRDYLYRITVYPNYNFVVVDCDGFDVASLEENHNYTSTRRIQYSGQNSDYLLIGLDWKKFPSLFGS